MGRMQLRVIQDPSAGSQQELLQDTDDVGCTVFTDRRLTYLNVPKSGYAHALTVLPDLDLVDRLLPLSDLVESTVERRFARTHHGPSAPSTYVVIQRITLDLQR